MRATLHLLLALLLPGFAPALAAPCASDDPSFRLTGVSQCLIVRSYGTPTPATLVVWLHGNVSSGGPANYHFELASRLIEALPDDKVLSVAIVRPGYPDGEGNESTVAFLHSGRGDNFTMENISEVGAVIQRLKNLYKPNRLVVVGHSGGAATAAVLAAAKPGLLDAAILLACPCDLTSWRAGRRPYGGSEDPIKWAPKVDKRTSIVAITGDRDDNTLPAQVQGYVSVLRAAGVPAEFVLVPEATHNGIIRVPQVQEAIIKHLAPR